MIPFNAIPDANVIPANDGLAIADPRSLRVTLRKGYCVIWNFRDLKGDLGKVRKGSEFDVRRLQKTFKHLGADIWTFENHTKEDMTKEVRRLYLTPSSVWANYDHLVVVIMSHGEEGKIQTSNALNPADPEASFFYLDELTRYLSKTEGLAGKPKFIFVNACRGDIRNPSTFAISNNLK